MTALLMGVACLVGFIFGYFLATRKVTLECAEGARLLSAMTTLNSRIIRTLADSIKVTNPHVFIASRMVRHIKEFTENINVKK